MLINQQLTIDRATRTVHLRNTVDFSHTLEAARQNRELNDTGRFGNKNHECQLLGFVPDDLWHVDPWLRTAQQALMSGDLAEYQKHMMTFFRIHPQFCGNRKTKYWNGSRAVLLDK